MSSVAAGAYGNAGGSFSNSGFGQALFGTVSGGLTSSLQGGNFWEGAATGLVVSLLNHSLHKIADGIQNSNGGGEPSIYDNFRKWADEQVDKFAGMLDSSYVSSSNAYITGSDGYTYAVTSGGAMYKVLWNKYLPVDKITIDFSPNVNEINAGKNIVSLVKRVPKLLKEARNFSSNASWRNEINGLLGQLKNGNLNPGLGSKHLFSGIHELRASNGARIYFRNTANKIEILGYSNKANQTSVLNTIKSIYGK